MKDNYKEKEIISFGKYSSVYKIKNNKKSNIAIKEIYKENYKMIYIDFKNEIEDIMNTENSLNIFKTINSKKIFYIIMELCSFNLNNYLFEREKPFSINEIREILIQINNFFKKLNNKKIIHGNIKPSNILINVNENNKIVIKLSYFDSIKFSNKIDDSIDLLEKICLTTPPEILKGELFNKKSDIWSLGIIIYYMLYKRYPFNGEYDYNLLSNIISNQNIELNSENEELNNLFKRMLKVDVNKRISFEEYFNHSFFKQNQFPKFNFKCTIHSFERINYYCINCKMNICDSCINQHISHQIIPLSQIGINDSEFTTFTNLLNEIKENINKIKTLIEKIESFLNELKKNKKNYDIYKNDKKNNFKEYYINCLNIINDKCKFEDKIKIINLNNKYIMCKYKINEKILNKPIQILNCLDKDLRKFFEDNFQVEGIDNDNLKLNDDEINNNNCDISLNNKKIDFSFQYKFKKKGIYDFKLEFKNELKNINFMFFNCTSLISIDLTNFKFININDISFMFFNCSSLTLLNFSYLNSNSITDMRCIFQLCSSLTSLNLSNLNTKNVINMKNMLFECSSLIYKEEQSENIS